MKKILFSLMALVASMSMNAQLIKVYNGETLVKTYKANEATRVVFEEEIKVSSITLDQTTASVEIGNSITLHATVNPSNATDASFTWSSSDQTVATISAAGVVTTKKVGTTTIKATANDGSGVFGACELTVTPLNPLLSGDFSVSADKTVKFTRCNLYWDGSASAFHFEDYANQSPKTYNANHVGHFFWTSTPETSYAATYTATGNNLWCDESHKITVDEIDGLYVLSQSEWNYLLTGRTNASALKRGGVRVGGDENYCLIIAPDGFTEELKGSYTLQEVNSKGLLCLPLTSGGRTGSSIEDSYFGNYWTSTNHGSDGANVLEFNSGNGFEKAGINSWREYYYGVGIRLVK